nr:ORF18 [Pieris rapae granulovirus]
MLSLSINVQNNIIPILYVNDKIYFGLTEIQEYFNLTYNNCYIDSFKCGDIVNETTKFDNNKLFITETGLVLLLERKNIHYNCYWFIISIAKNVINSFNNNENNTCNDDAVISILKTIDDNVKIIKDYVTVMPV